ncbi:hypothetical protein QNM99_19270 [Pseudomonas sp. PCH446]
MAFGQQRIHKMRADEPSAPCYQYPFGRHKSSQEKRQCNFHRLKLAPMVLLSLKDCVAFFMENLQNAGVKKT